MSFLKGRFVLNIVAPVVNYFQGLKQPFCRKKLNIRNSPGSSMAAGNLKINPVKLFLPGLFCFSL